MNHYCDVKMLIIAFMFILKTFYVFNIFNNIQNNQSTNIYLLFSFENKKSNKKLEFYCNHKSQLIGFEKF
jgi:hypothetical protein